VRVRALWPGRAPVRIFPPHRVPPLRPPAARPPRPLRRRPAWDAQGLWSLTQRADWGVRVVRAWDWGGVLCEEVWVGLFGDIGPGCARCAVLCAFSPVAPRWCCQPTSRSRPSRCRTSSSSSTPASQRCSESLSLSKYPNLQPNTKLHSEVSPPPK